MLEPGFAAPAGPPATASAPPDSLEDGLARLSGDDLRAMLDVELAERAGEAPGAPG